MRPRCWAGGFPEEPAETAFKRGGRPVLPLFESPLHEGGVLLADTGVYCMMVGVSGSAVR